MQLFFCIIVFAITIVSTEARMCYNCTQLTDDHCYPIRGLKNINLVDCPPGWLCGLTIELHPTQRNTLTRERKCVRSDWCPGESYFPICAKCDKDACNDDYLIDAHAGAFSLSFNSFYIIMFTFAMAAQ